MRVTNKMRIIDLLTERKEGLTARQIANILGLTLNTAAREITRIRDVLYIKDYRRVYPDGSPAAIFALGEEEDAPRPEPLTKSERARRHRDLKAARNKDPLCLQIKLLRKEVQRVSV